MKKLYDEYYRLSDGEKISDKKFIARISIDASIILLCIFIMGISALAYFTSDLRSEGNVIAAGEFAPALVITNDTTGEQVELIHVGENTSVAFLSSGVTYTVNMSATGTSSGFYVMCYAPPSEYYTRQIGQTELGSISSEPLAFELAVTEDATVSFVSYWGTSSYYDEYKRLGDVNEHYVTDGESIVIDTSDGFEENAENYDN